MASRGLYGVLFERGGRAKSMFRGWKQFLGWPVAAIVGIVVVPFTVLRDEALERDGR